MIRVTFLYVQTLLLVMYKCSNCLLLFENFGGYKETDDGYCPKCGGKLEEMCPNDTGKCQHGLVSGVKKCELCGKWVCPLCGNHNVEPMSRVTGYYGPVNSWNKGKQAELSDRTRYEV